MELGRRAALYARHRVPCIARLTALSAGKVADIKEGKAQVTSNRGNTISKNGTEDDPAVVIERSGVSLHVL